ncbi:TM0106 family RecB-like putative nuclease [Geodermatophilus sp. SYSU D00867]
MAIVTTTVRPVLLGGYSAKRCPRATHNQYDSTVPRVVWEPDAAVHERKEAGRSFEDDVVVALLRACPSAVDLREHDGDKTAHVAATLSHLQAGTRLIIGGRLPDDVVGGRTGKPDLLVRAENRSDGRPGYHVGDIKHHLVTERRNGSPALVSVPSTPERASAAARDTARLRWREDDCLQLAHYWRLLQASGFAAEHPWGAVLGTDGLRGYVADPLALVWHDLAEPAFETFSRASGTQWRSSLERYDHEHGFRVDVALVARRRTGAPDDPEPLVLPIGHEECATCEWAPVCVDTLPDDDLSNELRADLSIREYLTLRKAGIDTVADLATADVDELLTQSYETETAHLRTRARRLRKARLNAELAHAGVVLRRRPDAPVIPSADVEYDVDCEWNPQERVYLWGVLRSKGGTSSYMPFVDFGAADDEAEYDLLVRFLTWLDGQVRADAAAGRSTAVFYYSPAETKQIRRITEAVGRPLPTLRTGAAVNAWIDLLPYVRASLDSRWGHGLKIVAVYGAGFEWRDEDPGGLQSQLWYEQAVAGDDTAELRLLAYSEDDVNATFAVRRWVRRQPLMAQAESGGRIDRPPG